MGPDKIATMSYSVSSSDWILPIEGMHVLCSSTKISLANFRGFEQLEHAFDVSVSGAVRALPKRTS